MAATKRIPISPEIWGGLSRLKKQGQTFDDLIEKMVKNQKKLGLLKDMKRIEETAEFVDIMTIEEAHKRYGRL